MTKILLPLIFLTSTVLYAQKSYLIECDQVYQQHDTTVCFIKNERSISRKFYINDEFVGGQVIYKRKNKFTEIYDMTDKFLTLDGIKWIYNPEGHLIMKMTMKNGDANGETIVYFPNGNVRIKCNVVKNKPVGNAIYYYPNGKPRAVVSDILIDGKKGEKEQYFAENGLLVFEIESLYKKKKSESTYKYYHENGQPFYIFNDFGKGITAFQACYTKEGKQVSEGECECDSARFNGQTYDDIRDTILDFDMELAF